MSHPNTKDALVEKLTSNPLIKNGSHKLVNGEVFWVVQKHSGGSFISAIHLYLDNGVWKYRSYSEGSTPRWVHCPSSFFDGVAVTNKAWRDKVIATSSRSRKRSL